MLYFVRHGESTNNVRRIFSGQKNNPELTSKGEAQAKEAGGVIIEKGIKIDRILCSPLKRAVRTAELIAETLDFSKEDIEIDNRLAEYDMGSLSGQPVYHITSEEMVSAKGAEDPQSFMDRVVEALKEYSSDKEKNILIVSHAGVGRVIGAYRKKMDAKDFYNLDRFPNGELIELRPF